MCTIAFIFVDLHAYSVHTMYVCASLFVIYMYMYMSMWPSISHCSKWSPPSGKSISAGSCAGNHVVVAVGNELYCLDIQPSDLTELRLVYTETSEPLTHRNMVQNTCSRNSELKFRPVKRDYMYLYGLIDWLYFLLQMLVVTLGLTHLTMLSISLVLLDHAMFHSK